MTVYVLGIVTTTEKESLQGTLVATSMHTQEGEIPEGGFEELSYS